MELQLNRIRNFLLQISVFISLSCQICGSEEILPATVIAFGSCNRQNKPQDHWNIIRAANPDLFLWTGDSVYPKNNSIRGLEAAFEKLTDDSMYKEFQNVAQIDGIWDDHDMGVNDGGKHVAFKEQRQNLFMKYITSNNKKSYGSQTCHTMDLNAENMTNAEGTANRSSEEQSHSNFGTFEEDISMANNFLEADSTGNADYLYKTIDRILPNGAVIRFILLDTRSYRDFHYIRSVGEFKYPFTPLVAALIRGIQSVLGIGRQHKGEILGEKQWKWLESTLHNSPADFHGIISSIQILTTNPVVESWGHFPYEKKRFFELLKKFDPPGLFFLSGDVHHGELSRATVVRERNKVLISEKDKDKDEDKYSPSTRNADIVREKETDEKTIKKLSVEVKDGDQDNLDLDDSSAEKVLTLTVNHIENKLNTKGEERSDSRKDDITQGRVGKDLQERKNDNADDEVWVEVTSSGLTHTCGDSTINKILCPKMLKMFASHRLPKNHEKDNDNVYIGKNYGIITSLSSSESAEFLYLNVSVVSLETSTAVLSHTVRSSIHDKNCRNLHSNFYLKITEFKRKQCYDRRPILEVVYHEFPIFIPESVAENLFDIIRTSLVTIIFCCLFFVNRKIIFS